MKPFFIKRADGQLINLNHITYIDIRQAEDDPTYVLWAYIAQARLERGKSTVWAAWPITSGDEEHCQTVQTEVEDLLKTHGCLHVLESEKSYWLEEVDDEEADDETDTDAGAGDEGEGIETLYDTETEKDSEMPEVKKVPMPAWFRNVPAQFYAEEDVDMEDDLTM